ncbi:MAG TPA: LLM class F420-dependent oxidoreductase [Candidatus Binatia bacterium]|nr:LLM class F420-dependent oxidoreductase [Candidatus Binatia bacterium]
MQFAVLLPQFGPFARGADVGERLRAVATAADRLGYDVLWTAEHVIYPPAITTPYPYGARFPFAVDDPFLDVATTLAWVASCTGRVRLGSAVVVLPYHHPITLAKAVATLDVLSRGRVLLGVAGGWLREEFALLGIPFRERGARTDEAIALVRALWSEERVTFHGRWHDLADAAFFPKPIQRPGPPIWIGGGSPAALRRAGRLGDGWIAVPRPDVSALAADVATIRRHAEAAGRDPRTIGVAASGPADSVTALLDLVPALEHAGVTIVTVPALFWARSHAHALELMEEVAARAGLAART